MIELRILIGAIVLGLFIWAGVVVKGWRDDSISLQTVGESARQADVSTGDVTSATGAVVAESQRIDIVVTQTRQQALEQYNDLRNKDPEVAAYGNNPVPQLLRDIARTRRLQRESFGGDGFGGPNDGATSPPSRSSEVHGAGDQR